MKKYHFLMIGFVIALAGIIFYLGEPTLSSASTCTSISSKPSLGYSCTSSGAAITVNFPAVSGAQKYVVDWWFTDPTTTTGSTNHYQECQKTIYGTSTTISAADNSTATKMKTSYGATVECYSKAYSYSYGIAYKAVTSACTTAYSPAASYAPNPQGDLKLSRVYGTTPSITATLHALSGTASYLLDWWFKTTAGVYTECTATTTDTSYTISKTGSYKKVSSTGSSCYPDADTVNVGMAYRSYTPCYGPYSNPATTTGTVSTSTTPVNPSPSPAPSKPTVNANLVVGLPGIGYNGNAPTHLYRTAIVELYDPSVTNPAGPGTKPLSTTTVTLTYHSTGNSAGYFATTSTINLPSIYTVNNQYQILVKIPQYLFKLETTGSSSTTPTVFTLTPGTTVNLPILYMDPGDLVTANGGANLLNLDDYTQLKTCFGNSSSCPTTTDGIPVADLNDDGSVNIVDFNIMLRSLANFINNESSHCNGLECQGD